MSKPNNRRTDPGQLSSTETTAIITVAGLVLVSIGALYAAVHLGHLIGGSDATIPSNPFEVIGGLITGAVTWPEAGTAILIGAAVLVVALAVFVGVVVRRVKGKRTRVDAAAAYMGRGRDIKPLSRKNAEKVCRQFRMETQRLGLPVGITVAGRQRLVGTWEDMHLDIWGPRTGKTTSRAIPAVLDAPGAVLVTSNKRDIVDATRDVRAAAGDVRVFDPQQITGEDASWWWNPLSYVTDEVKAAKLAEHFAAANTGDKKDVHFEDNGENLLAGCLLAAALDDRPITQVYTWLTRPGDEDPVDILRDHGFALTADQLVGIATTPDKERGSIYSTARRMTACLTYNHISSWVTTTAAGDDRPHFDPAAFVRSGGTLYSLSKEGKGSAGPLVMALTAAVVEAGEELAAASAAGRLGTPLVGVLDEAANVCRWRELPNLYSHYGSRGIVLMTILQSWSQGVEVWGESGMKKLWSAANIKVYGGGVSEDAFLEHLSKTIGDYDRQSSSVSSGKGNRTVSRQLHRERILDVAALAALPKGRAVVFAHGARPTLIRTQPWMDGPHAAAVNASITAHEPHAHKPASKAEAAA